ncbi:MAG: OPT/YSL family transporter, partial [Candidatus Thermoplasmatota archaeon]|nr:OPT/YSL family transporter [Candidatus Thermoplasmatota archaeon]
PLTPDGIEKMEKGELDYFDEEVWSNLNTGALEQYLDERSKTIGFDRSRWIWRHIAIGIGIGLLFAIINQYVGLKVGTIVGGAWYVAYLLGLSLRWKPTEVNMVAGAATGTAATCTGFVFAYPSIYLLTYSADYPQLIAPEAIPPVWVAVSATILGGLLGVLYFTIFRRVWLVEDPLPVPGFEASVKLVDLANDLSTGSMAHARRTLKMVVKWLGVSAFFTFLRDFRIIANHKPEIYGSVSHLPDGTRAWVPDSHISVFDSAFGGTYYSQGGLRIPYATYTIAGIELIPIQIASGWFMRLRTALLVVSGTMFTWFIIVPLAVGIDLPVYVPSLEGFLRISTLGPVQASNYLYNGAMVTRTFGSDMFFSDTSAYVAYYRVARIIAVGAILGGGMTAILKMGAVFKSAMADIPMFQKDKKDEKTVKGGSYVQGRGWYEWPMSHISYMMFIVPVGITIIFAIGGFPIIPSLLFGILLVAVTFFLGAVGVKTMGETARTPVSGTSFIVLLLLMGVFAVCQSLGLMTQSELIVMSIFGAAIFGSAMSLSADIIGDFKIGIYAGTRPFHLVKGEITGLVMGATVAVVGASLFSYGLAMGELNLAAPQANAFATLVMSMMGGSNVLMLLSFLAIGAIIGTIAELTTGMGTAFGLGMYLPLPLNFPLVIGGSLREWWTKTRLQPRAKKEGWSERQITLANVDKYMMMAGLIIGEAIMGTIVAMTLIIPLLTGG